MSGAAVFARSTVVDISGLRAAVARHSDRHDTESTLARRSRHDTVWRVAVNSGTIIKGAELHGRGRQLTSAPTHGHLSTATTRGCSLSNV